MTCIHCGTELTNDNWLISFQIHKNYICRLCQSKYQKQYRDTHKVEINLKARLQYSTFVDRERKRKYYNTPIGKIASNKKVFKRRQRGYNCLNEWFQNSIGHHIDRDNVIFIPREIHTMINHNTINGKNMEAINTYAYFFLVQNNIKQLTEMI
jgi:hypothetical protein